MNPKRFDGKEVRNFLWNRYTPILSGAAIPVDRKERAKALDEHDKRQQKFLVTVQVEAFSKDHSLERLCARWPQVKRGDWEFNCELDPSHDIGMLGTKLTLDPLVNLGSQRIQ